MTAVIRKFSLRSLIPLFVACFLPAASALNTTPAYTTSGHVNYVAFGASFRSNNGNNGDLGTYGACSVKTASGVVRGGTTVQTVVGAGATLNNTARTASQLVPTAPGTTVKAAYLYWTASEQTGFIDTTVSFTVGTTTSTVTAARSGSRAIPAQNGYTAGQATWAVADVTSLVAANPNATMSMSDLSIAIGGDLCVSSNVYGSWNIYIVYENLGLPTSKVSLFDAGSTALDLVGGPVGGSEAGTSVTGFYLPGTNNIDRVARVTAQVSEGDPNATTDYFKLGTTSGTATQQSSPSRPATNYFRGIVTEEDTSGVEQIQTGSSVTTTSNTGGTDIATINADAATLPAQVTSIYAAVGSEGRGEMIILNSLAVIANSSNADVITTKKLEDPLTTTRDSGDSFKYIIDVVNSGPTEALALTPTDTLPKGLTYQSAEISLDGGATWTSVTPGVTVNAVTGVSTITFPTIRRLDPDGTVWGGTNVIATLLGTQSVKYRLTVSADGSVLGTLRNSVNTVTESNDTNLSNNTGSVDITIVNRSLTIIKDALPNSAQDFAFTATGTGVTSFSLDDDSDPTLPNAKSFFNLVAGTYTITEQAYGDWTLTAIRCTPTTGTTVNLATRTLTITLTAGAKVSCTFENTIRLPVIPQMTKYVRNVSTGAAYRSNSEGAPGEVLQYCIAFSNTGGTAFNFKLSDIIPANTTYVAGSLYYVSPATNLTGSVTDPASVTLPTNWALNALTSAGKVTSVELNTNADGRTVNPTGLPANTSGMLCFRARIN